MHREGKRNPFGKAKTAKSYHKRGWLNRLTKFQLIKICKFIRV